MSFTITSQHFKLNNKPFFLHSAEMHYFRIKIEKWGLHLDKIIEAGCNTVSTYIPWDWHEIKEGSFDFTGKTEDERDLISWLDLCKEKGLYVTVKPGPYILAEYAGAGIPEWFISKYRKSCEVKNSRGGAGQDDVMSFMHPIYLEYVKKWYDQIMPIIAKRQISANGNIILLQVCNEVGVFTWLKKQADYSAHCLEMYKKFCRDVIYYVPAIPDDLKIEYENNKEIANDIIWHEFWRYYYAEYLRLLIKEIRSRGVDLQLFHNLPGWIYGSGWEFPVNITMYNQLNSDYPDIILGVDHIPENISYRNFHDDLIINEIVKAQQGRRGPIFGAEFQAGSREYCAVTFPCELDLFYKASFANGLKGWNYYMFSQGKNPESKGFFGPTFYWFTPLDNDGNETSLYPVIKKTGGFIKTFQDDLALAKKKSKICILFYQRYYATELAKIISKNKCDINFNHISIRRSAFFDGLLKALQILNIDFDILDAEVCAKEDLENYDQAWMFSCDIMGSDVQQKLVDYVNDGGKLAIYPTLPKYDLEMNPCSILKDAVGNPKETLVYLDSPKLKVLDNKDISVANPVVQYSGVTVSRCHGVTEELTLDSGLATHDSRLYGFLKDVGKGKMLVLGFYMGYGIEEHKKAYWDLLNKLAPVNKLADRTKDRLVVKQSFANDSGFLFVGNYYNELEKDKIYYTHPVTNKKVLFPLSGDDMSIPGIYGFVSPISKKIGKNIKLLHTTSDIISINKIKKGIEIIIKGHHEQTGEMAFEGSFEKISIDDKNLNINSNGAYFYVSYRHSGKDQKINLFL